MKNAEIIQKKPATDGLLDYEKAYREFSWEAIKKDICIRNNKVNIAYEAIYKHAQRSEEHTSELQSLAYLLFRLLL